MDIIGIICEYNPFHNGHKYHIDKIKELYPNSLLVLVINGYFMQRGEVSILTKEDKVKIALENNIDLVVEHPFVYSSNSADIFAESAVTILNHLNVDKIIFGSESNDIELLKKIAAMQVDENFDNKVKEYLKEGVNYPTALNKALGADISSPNDLLGIAYVKAIIKNNYNIEPLTIKRTNNYHDLLSNDNIISASNIREKHFNNTPVDKYTSYRHLFKKSDKDKLFDLLKFKIITDKDLSKYLSVDEGLEYKIVKEINNVNNITELIKKLKSKRYTYNRISRMLIHILIGLSKEDNNRKINYVKVLGFNKQGQFHLNNVKKDNELLIDRKISEDHIEQKYELTASLIYDMINGTDTYKYETNNKPTIIKK